LENKMIQDRDNSSTRFFQGRPIVEVEYNGQKVEVVKGMLTYRLREAQPVENIEAGTGSMAEAPLSPLIDHLGIGTIVVDDEGTDIEIESAASVAMMAADDVEWIEPVMIDHGCVTPNDPQFVEQWAFDAINARRGWDIWTGSPDRVVLAVLDTGIPIQAQQLSHPDLNDSVRFFPGPDTANKDDDPTDDHGHGTHVTGIAVAMSNNGVGVTGLCWKGPVLAVKVLNSNNDGTSESFEKGVIEAVRFAEQIQARLVINYSGGGPHNNTKLTAVEYALSKGALIVAAAGNKSGGSIIYPAAYSSLHPNVMAVGAVDNALQRPSFASRGPEMTVVAPGVDILSTMPNYHVTLNSQGFQTKYDRMRGTSQASPMVAALACLVWSRWPGLSAAQVRQKITTSAKPLSGSQEDFGSGIIDVEKALT
jgi:thermitase